MQVYALTGVPPEIQAYAMAKYSRSAQSMRESIGELSEQRAEQFLDTFYFQYGHRSIADLAHVALAVEEISILAAIQLVDEPLWDGQERSTRYQDFKASGYQIPVELGDGAARERYAAAADALFEAYHALTKTLTDLLVEAYPLPAGGDRAAHRRTLRARAFDVTRALLPLATRTSVGQITSARVLERQIARLRADERAEVRAIGEAMQAACREPGHDPTRERVIAALNGHAEGNAALRVALEPVRPAPTLVKYAEPSPYAPAARAELAQVAAALLGALPPDRSRPVDLVEPADLLGDAATALLYGADAGGRAYRQVAAVVAGLSGAEKEEIVDLAFQGRGPHDEWLRELCAGYPLVFDFLIDIGSFRDLHRHRRCIQIIQAFTPEHGHEGGAALVEQGLGAAAPAAVAAGIPARLDAALDAAGGAAREAAAADPVAAPYLLPLGYRMRAAFKMDLAQAAYMIELRTRPGGHIAYRRAAWQMYEALRVAQPAFARHIRATDPSLDDAMLHR